MQLDHGTRRFAELETEQRQRSVDQAVGVEFKFRHQTACSKGPTMSSSRRWRPKRPSYPKSPRVGNPQATSAELVFRACHKPDSRLLGSSTRSVNWPEFPAGREKCREFRRFSPFL